MNNDLRNLSKWLNEEQETPIDRQALARVLAMAEQPAQQEPVAWMYPDDYERMTTSETFCTVYSVEVGSATRGESTVALYTSPPAQRKPLSDEKAKGISAEAAMWGEVWEKDFIQAAIALIRKTEAAHGIKEQP